jgi:hypothetical protein
LALIAAASASSALEAKTSGVAYTRSVAATAANALDAARGSTLDVTVHMEYAGKDPVNALGCVESLPDGWAFEGIVQDTDPAILIAPNTGAGGILEFSWLEVPAFPVNFTYRVSTGGIGGSILGQSLYRQSGPEARSATVVSAISASGVLTSSSTQSLSLSLEPEISGTLLRDSISCPYHSADIDADNVISMSELLRVVQFYNVGALHCDASTEDGYAPGTGDETCTPHDSDYNPQDWTISSSELLRVAQFYNSDGYRYDPTQTSEDGYLPGQPPVMPGDADTLSCTGIGLTCGVTPEIVEANGIDAFNLYVVNDEASGCSDVRAVDVSREPMCLTCSPYEYGIDLEVDNAYHTTIPEENSPPATIQDWGTFCPQYVVYHFTTIEFIDPDNPQRDGLFTAVVSCLDDPVAVSAYTFADK